MFCIFVLCEHISSHDIFFPIHDILTDCSVARSACIFPHTVWYTNIMWASMFVSVLVVSMYCTFDVCGNNSPYDIFPPIRYRLIDAYMRRYVFVFHIRHTSTMYLSLIISICACSCVDMCQLLSGWPVWKCVFRWRIFSMRDILIDFSLGCTACRFPHILWSARMCVCSGNV